MALYFNIIKKLKNVVGHAKIQVDIVKQQNKRKFMTQSQRSKSKYAYDGQVAQMKRGNLYGNEKNIKNCWNYNTSINTYYINLFFNYTFQWFSKERQCNDKRRSGGIIKKRRGIEWK